MTYENELFQERVVRVERPSAHWTLLRAPNGAFLGASDAGFAVYDYVDDKAIWESVEAEASRNIASHHPYVHHAENGYQPCLSELH